MAPIIQPLTTEPREVGVADLEAELSALWRSAAEDPDTRNAVTRACALTLLVYAENQDAAREVSNLIRELTRQNPCRAVIMVVEPEASPTGLAAWISAHCHLPGAGEKQVCSEQVTVVARGDAARGLDSVVLPLTVPGLPVFLWWRAGGFAPPDYFDQVLRVTNRAVIDSGRFRRPEEDLRSLNGVIEKYEIAFSDLNWARLTPWRELIAQSFDAADRRQYLAQMTQVRIEYERESPRVAAQKTQALLLVGWLASRLKWRPERGGAVEQGSSSFFFKSAQGRVEAQLVARPFDGGGKGACFSIVLTAGSDRPATITLSRGPAGKCVMARGEISGRLPVAHNVRLEVLDEVDLVNEELKFLGRDGTYEEALGMVAQMAALP